MELQDTHQRVFRVGYRPAPWDWADWRWAGPNGRFSGRWDALDANLYRTLYAGESMLACLLELLAPFRPDPTLVAELGEIDVDPDDALNFPTQVAGVLPVSDWLAVRRAQSAQLDARMCFVTHSRTLRALYPRFAPIAEVYGYPDFDASVLKDARPRQLTQEISQYLWLARDNRGDDLCDGIRFGSRHGDDLALWAIFERPQDGRTSAKLSDLRPVRLHAKTREFVEALSMLGITAR